MCKSKLYILAAFWQIWWLDIASFSKIYLNSSCIGDWEFIASIIEMSSKKEIRFVNKVKSKIALSLLK